MIIKHNQDRMRIDKLRLTLRNCPTFLTRNTTAITRHRTHFFVFFLLSRFYPSYFFYFAYYCALFAFYTCSTHSKVCGGEVKEESIEKKENLCGNDAESREKTTVRCARSVSHTLMADRTRDFCVCEVRLKPHWKTSVKNLSKTPVKGE